MSTPKLTRSTADIRAHFNWKSDHFMAEILATGTVGNMGRHPHMKSEPLSKSLAWSDVRGWMQYQLFEEGGAVWRPVSEPIAHAEIGDALRSVYVSIVSEENATVDLAKQNAGLLGAAKAKSVAHFLKSHLLVPEEAWDADPMALNARNGVVNLRKGVLTAPTPAGRHTKVTVAYYSAEAVRKAQEADDEERTLSDLMALQSAEAGQEDLDAALKALPADVAGWMRYRIGQAITGYRPDDDLLIFNEGIGANGKSTLLGAVLKAISGYGVTVTDKVLLANPGDHPADLMTLRGARLAVLEELPEGRHLNTQRLKLLVGTETITARAMRQDFVEFPVTHSMFVNTNFVPVINDTDEGTWRRLALVRWPYRFRSPGSKLLSPNERHGDPGLRLRLINSPAGQHEAILRWAVAGAIDLSGHGPEVTVPVGVPHSVEQDSEAWRIEADQIHGYLNEFMSFDREGIVSKDAVYTSFAAWQANAGRQTWSKDRFTKAMQTHRLFTQNGCEAARVMSTSVNSTTFGAALNRVNPTKCQVWKGLRFN